MVETATKRLEYLCEVIPGLLLKIPEAEFIKQSSPDKWSKKEILGHLIDSATNNHQRFIRIQFEDKPTIVYDQVNWNRFSNHNIANSDHLKEFWANYNRHLIVILRRIPVDNLKRECNIGNDLMVTLEWLISDYVRHLEHHLRQIVDY